MCNHENLFIFCQRFYCLLQLVFFLLVHIGRSFVSKNNGRFENKGAGYNHTMLLVAGKIVRHTVELFIKSPQLYNLFHKPLVHGDTIQFHRKDNIFIDIQDRNKVVIPEDKTNAAPAENRKLFVLEFG